MKKKKLSKSKIKDMADISFCLPSTVFAAVKKAAAKAKIPYQRFIRQTLESAVQSRSKA